MIGKWVANNWQDIVATVVIVAQVAAMVASGGLTEMIVTAGKHALAYISENVDFIGKHLEGIINAASALIAGDWAEFAKAAGKTMLNMAKDFALEEAAKVLGKIDAIARVLEATISFVMETDFSEIASAALDKGIKFVEDKIASIENTLNSAVAFIKNIDIGEIMAAAGNYMIDYATSMADKGIQYLTAKIDKGVNYLTTAANQGINYLTTAANQGINYLTTTANQGINYLNHGINYATAQINSLPGMINGYVDAFHSALPSIPGQLVRFSVNSINAGIQFSQPQTIDFAKNTLSNHLSRISDPRKGLPNLPSLASTFPI